jgi:putative FmdB family regulatory protein
MIYQYKWYNLSIVPEEVSIMPFYDLKCKNCSEEFNIMARMSERDQKTIKCPKCSGNELETVFKNVNIVLSKKAENNDCPNIHKCGGCCRPG